MTNSVAPPLDAITALDADVLLSPARHPFAIPGGSIRSRPLWTPRLASTLGVHQIDWELEGDGAAESGSLVLKVIVRRTPDQEPPEAALYASGAFRHLPNGLGTPCWYSNADLGMDRTGIWLDLERDDPGIVWDVERFGLAARHLGRLAGSMHPAYREQATKRPPRSFWSDTAYVEETFRAFSTESDNDLARRAWPGAVKHALLELWSGRCAVLERAETLPVMPCHGDAQRRNLFAHREQTVAIDWANVSLAPVGMDIATLVHYALAYFDLDIANAMELERSVLNGYASGLEEAGASIDRDTVWFGFAAQLVFLGLLETGSVLRLASDPASHDRAEAFYGQPLGAIMDRRRAIAGYLLDLGSRMKRKGS